ncbi:MAG: PKD domain-containing protein [Chitinophagaceae bacterium]
MFKSPLLLLALLGVIGTCYAQDFTNKGKEFWLGYGNHQQMYAGQDPGMSVYVTSDVSTPFTVEIGGVVVGTYNLTAGQVIEVPIPSTAFLKEEKVYNDRGIHITADKAVVAYAHIYYASVSGATLCLPVSTLGQNYYSVNFTQVAQATINNQSYSYFFVVATEDNTSIEVMPTANTQTMTAGQTYTINLNKGEIYNVLSSTDLTGSTIKSVNNGGGCKRIAVFCGSGRIGIGCVSNVTSSDNLVQQMYPTSTWGKKYVTVPSVTRPMNYYRVMRPDPATVVKVDGNVIGSGAFTDGFYYQFNDVSPHVIEADKPILVAQYFTTQSCGENTNNGDPEMIYLNPVEQTISNVTLTSLRLINQQNNAHYVNVVIQNTPGAINTFKIDGATYAYAFKPHPVDASYAYAQIPVSLGNHNLVCDTPFNAIAYGFGNTESYGYSAGTNLKDLYQFISIRNDYATVNFPASCKNTPFKFAMTFPYQPTLIAWKFNGLFPDITLSNPAYDSSWVVNGRTLYRYRLPTSYTIPTAGTYSIMVVANNPTGDGCNGVQEIRYDLEIFDPPQASFTFQHSGCLSDSVQFIDVPNAGGRTLTSWSWDFGDGATSTLQNPKHLYLSPVTNIKVKHSVISDVGCISDVYDNYISISPPPVADFTIATATCEGKDITFNNNSSVSVGIVSKSVWTYGDGNTETVTHVNPVTHNYPAKGNYTISLQSQDNLGCKSNVVSKTVEVHVNPVVDFTTPVVCVDDANPQFTNTSTISDGTASQMTYQWTFGDGGTATAKDPTHKYALAGQYSVGLTSTSNNGCATIATKSFTVNSGQPKAVFKMDASAINNQLCAADTIKLTDASTIDIGNIIRTEIYWDYTNDPTNKTVDNSPASGKVYQHKYADPGTAGTKTYQLRYVVYSGESCPNESRVSIVVKSNPGVQFDGLDAVCEEVAPFTVNSARELLGLTGTGEYSGDGITASGLFDPAKAKPGTHVIRYTYTATNGCTTSAQQNIRVFPTPVADAGPDKGVLQGGYTTLQAYASGNNIAVEWTPNSFINNTNIITPRVSPTQDMTYTLTVTSSDGCMAKDEVFVKYLEKIRIPNIFSPNGDGVNDTWVIQYLDSYTDCQVDVFNRYGQKVFSSTGYSKPWDGTQQGHPLPTGTYYWIVNPKNGKERMSGSVTIVR